MRGSPQTPRVEDFTVLGIRYKPILSKTNRYYLRVTYFAGTMSFHENLFFDSENAFVKKNLKTWWTYRGGNLPIPEGTDEAAERAANELKVPSVIRVDLNSKYKEVVGADFTESVSGDETIPF
jgi:hypothetical protein